MEEALSSPQESPADERLRIGNLSVDEDFWFSLLTPLADKVHLFLAVLRHPQEVPRLHGQAPAPPHSPLLLLLLQRGAPLPVYERVDPESP